MRRRVSADTSPVPPRSSPPGYDRGSRRRHGPWAKPRTLGGSGRTGPLDIFAGTRREPESGRSQRDHRHALRDHEWTRTSLQRYLYGHAAPTLPPTCSGPTWWSLVKALLAHGADPNARLAAPATDWTTGRAMPRSSELALNVGGGRISSAGATSLKSRRLGGSIRHGSNGR